jgi:hypothetical protein
VGGVNGAANFGTADIGRWEDTLTLSLRNEAGEPVRRHSVRLDVDARAERKMGHIGAGEWKGREATVHVIDPKLLRALIRMSKHCPATFMRLSFDEITNQGEWGLGCAKM